MVATGLYTSMIDWNPIIRAGAHLTGAFAIPAVGALTSSLVMHGIEGVANLGINLYNKMHPEKLVEPFEINQKLKNTIKFISSAIVGITYAYATLGTEMDQFANSGIFQTEQYLADIGGSLGGIFAFHKLDIKDTATSFMSKIWNFSKVIVKPINEFEDKITGKSKNNPEKISNIEMEEVNTNAEGEKKKDEPHIWELSLYKNFSKGQDEKTTPYIETPDMTVQTIQVGDSQKTSSDVSHDKSNVDDEK